MIPGQLMNSTKAFLSIIRSPLGDGSDFIVDKSLYKSLKYFLRTWLINFLFSSSLRSSIRISPDYLPAELHESVVRPEPGLSVLILS